MKVSFDYDHTLTNPKIEALASKFVKIGAEVHITTSRFEKSSTKLPYDNREVYKMADKLGIAPEDVHFTNGKDKAYFLKEFDLHFDDDDEEITLINDHLENCVGALIE